MKALAAANENNLRLKLEIAVISTEKEFGTLDPEVVSGEIKKLSNGISPEDVAIARLESAKARNTN